MERNAKKYQLPITFNRYGAPQHLEEDTSVLLFRASRELVFNMVKHSQAAKGAVSLHYDAQTVKIVVADDGAGFDPSNPKTGLHGKQGFGLFSIKERLEHRGGDLVIESEPGKGTQIAMALKIDTDLKGF